MICVCLLVCGFGLFGFGFVLVLFILFASITWFVSFRCFAVWTVVVSLFMLHCLFALSLVFGFYFGVLDFVLFVVISSTGVDLLLFSCDWLHFVLLGVFLCWLFVNFVDCF